MMTTKFRAFLTASILVTACRGQDLFSSNNFINKNLNGLRFYGISLFSGYSTSAYPQGGLTFVPDARATRLGSDSNYGGMLSAGWQHHRDRTNMSLEYTLSYTGDTRYSNLNAFGHDLKLSVSRDLTSKWTFALSGSGQDATFSQYAFQPSSLSQISASSASFNDVSAVFAVGQFSDPQTASALTNLPALQSTAQSALIGYHILTYNAAASVSYAFTRHVSFQFGSFVDGGQTRTDQQNTSAPPSYVLPKTVGGDVGVSLDYDLSPRTTLGFNLSGTGISNRYQRVATGVGSASLGRKMGRHWFLRGYGGGAYTRTIQRIYGTPTTRQIIGGGSLGFRTYGNIWLASYDRSSYGGAGLAVGRNTNLSGAWTWHRPASRWSTNASAGRIQMVGNGYDSITGWQTMAGISRQVASTLALTASYVHLDSRGSFLGSSPVAFKVNTVRLTIAWSPYYGL